MKYLLKFGFLALAFGIVTVAADTANAQYRPNNRAVREYREDVRDARREYRDDLRDGDNRYKARREYMEELRDARQEYIRNVTRGRTGWYYYQNNRRYFRPYSQYSYRNGRFIRRW